MSSLAKQKRKAERAAKAAAKSGTSTPRSRNGTETPLSSTSVEDLAAQLNGTRLNGADIPVGATTSEPQDSERSAVGVLASQPESRDIKIDQFSLSFHGRVLIENSTIELNYGQRYGLLGANGSGKSTFLATLAAREVPIPEHIDVYLLKEEAEPSEMNGVEYILAEARKKVDALEAEIERMSMDPENMDEMALQGLYDRLEEMDPNTFESKVSGILTGLGFDSEMLRRPTKDMSGGWRMRVSLGQALFIKPLLLLLDEPTNHLDLEAVVWLEAYLSKYPHCLVLTSHSQDFLNNVCSQVMDLTIDRKLVYYGGNYDTYVRTKEELEINQTKAYNKQQDEIAHIKKFIASAGTYANLVKQAKSKQKIIDKMEAEGLIQLPARTGKISFKFEDKAKLPPPNIAFADVAFAYDREIKHALYKNLSFGVDMDSRVAIVGKNGTGKSTLVNLITGDLLPIRGSVSRHTGLKLAKYSQHSADQLPYDKTPLHYFMDRYKEKYPGKDVAFWRQQLGRFGISGSHQTSEIRVLSDGLKARVVFSQLALESPHIILLDEPTNHLDIQSIDALAKACNEFTGGIVLVSHDFRLIRQVAEEIWEVKDKKVIKLDMSIEEYKKMLADENLEAVTAAASRARG